jgi:hypothetical protein
MKRFSKIIENIEINKYFKIKAEIELIIKAENEGDAGYTSDNILNSIEEMNNYSIINIEEISKDEISNIDNNDENNEL